MPPAKSTKNPAAVPAATPAPMPATSAPADPAALPPALDSPAAIEAYQALYDTLGRAYWEASDIDSKDRIQGARDAIYEILTDLNIARLKANTALFLALAPKIKHTNAALDKIKDDIAHITRNITTAASVVAAITRALSVAAMF
ncbi:hypothetical protein [Edaphobacter aggregans]|uniref:hypothetical protein n=1 Tax=Edaphobacter aggregans TaxID=570835 RepID=UPI000558B9C3|nr:hypothetical protein [Edaphobacter aggregans]